MSDSSAPSKTDLMYETVYNPRFVPTRSPKVSVKTVKEGGQTRYQMRIGSSRDYGTALYYDLDEASKIVWDLTSGNRTVHRIIQEARSTAKIKPDDVTGTLLFFAESGALASKEDPVSMKRVRVVSSFETQVVLVRNSRRFLGYAHRVLRPILRGSLFWLSMAIIIIGAAIFAPRFNSTFGDAVNFQISGSTVVGFMFYQFVVLAPVIVIHELAHGVALVHYGGNPGEIGTGLFYFGPMFYVDATDYFNLPRRQRIMVMWAGNLTTVLIGAILFLSRFLVQYPAAIGAILNMAAFWCFYSTLWNLAPPFETDGYYMLTDILGLPELKRDGFAYLKSVTLRLFHRKSPEPQGLTDRTRTILLGYSIFSIAFVAYVAFQSLRFTAYMAQDAGFWAGKVLGSTLTAAPLPPLVYFVGLASVSYFLMTISGYGVVVGKQLRKSLTRTLRFEALHDRDLSVFFYLPSKLSTSISNKFEAKVRSIAGGLTPNYSLGRYGPLFHATLRMEETTIPLSQVKVHLRQIEQRFYSAYQRLLASKNRAVIRRLTRFPDSQVSLYTLLLDMAGKTPSEEKSEVKGALKDFLERRERMAYYLLSSTFSTAWTIEIPPAPQYELLETVLPVDLAGDLTMTNLVDETEDFKKRTIYGFDSIAELAAKASVEQADALSHPERFQILGFFEPVRGRIIFVGRTERIENHLKELGSLFIVHIWSGYLDDLLSELNLNLYSVAKSFPAVPVDIDALQDGELRTLYRYTTAVEGLKDNIQTRLTQCQDSVAPSKLRLRELRTLFQPDANSTVGLFDAVLELNLENLRSIPSRVKELKSLSDTSFKWIEGLRRQLDSEQKRRKEKGAVRKKRILQWYLSTLPPSAGLAILGLILPNSLLGPSLIGAAATIQVAILTAYCLSRRSTKTVPRHPSMMFSQLLTPMYGLTQTLHSLTIGTTLLNPVEVLAKKERKKRGSEEKRTAAGNVSQSTSSERA